MNRRLVFPLAAALAVLVVLGLVWWATTGDAGLGDTATPSESSPSAATSPVAVEGYFPRSETVLALNYSIGVPACYGTLGEPAVTETDDAVVVRLHRVEPKKDRDLSCIQVVQMKSVDVTLDEPLGDRVVQDGGYDGKVVEEAASPYGDGNQADPSY